MSGSGGKFRKLQQKKQLTSDLDPCTLGCCVFVTAASGGTVFNERQEKVSSARELENMRGHPKCSLCYWDSLGIFVHCEDVFEAL